MRTLVNPLPALGVIQIIDSETGSCVLLPREDTTAFLKEFLDVIADTISDSASGGADSPAAVYSFPADFGERFSAPEEEAENKVVPIGLYSWRVDGSPA